MHIAEAANIASDTGMSPSLEWEGITGRVKQLLKAENSKIKAELQEVKANQKEMAANQANVAKELKAMDAKLEAILGHFANK